MEKSDIHQHKNKTPTRFKFSHPDNRNPDTNYPNIIFLIHMLALCFGTYKNTTGESLLGKR